MLPYWLLFAFFALGALLSLRGTGSGEAQGTTFALGGDLPQAAGAPPPPQWSPLQDRRDVGLFFGFGLIVLLLMIGLRFEVGGDWLNYQRIFERTRLLSFSQQLGTGDPGYQTLNWLVAQAGGDVWLVNLVCAAIFCWGLGRLARSQPEPWLAMVVAIPYLVIVVAMGYTRQAAALGVLMAGIAAVFRGAGVMRFALYVLLAALFHRTAIIALPLMTFVFPRSRGTNLLMIAALSVSLYVLFLQDTVELLQRNYLDARYSSQGAAVRVAQLAVAAALFVVARKSLRFSPVEQKTWRNFAVATFIMVPLLVLLPSSTVVDRVSLYLLPLQIAVLARLPLAITAPIIARMAVVAYSALVLFIWLNYAVHADWWLPYRTILVSDPLIR